MRSGASEEARATGWVQLRCEGKERGEARSVERPGVTHLDGLALGSLLLVRVHDEGCRHARGSRRPSERQATREGAAERQSGKQSATAHRPSEPRAAKAFCSSGVQPRPRGLQSGVQPRSRDLQSGSSQGRCFGWRCRTLGQSRARATCTAACPPAICGRCVCGKQSN